MYQPFKKMGLLPTLIVAAFAALSTQNAKAQFIISGDMFEGTSFSVTLQARDSVTDQPVGYASAYLQHPGDTLITNFSLTDAEGKAEIKKVTKGQYVLSVEFLGYLPYHKVFYTRDTKDLGIVRLVPDIKALEAAKVSAVVNPIEVRKDTLIYNAAAFKVGQNAYLIDLLKRMPGIEVDANGNVKVNGESVSQITVGGKTFFMGDNSAALNNLPAKVVDKVKIINKESDEAAFTGITDTKKRKVMDIELKDEYKQGWFGNLRLGGGATAYGKNDELRDPRGFLYTNTGMMSIYNEKDQLTMIESAMNAQLTGDAMLVMFGDDDNDEGYLGSGLPKAAQFGANLNTSRLKGMDSNISASVKRNRMDDLRHSSRKTFQEDSDDINSLSSSKTDNERTSLKLNGEFKKSDTRKYTLVFTPSFYFSDTDNNADQTSSTASGDVMKNQSDMLTGSSQKYFKTDGELKFGVKNLGKKRRSLTFTGEYVFGGSDGNSFEHSKTYYNALDTTIERNLFYDRNYSNYSVGGSAQYVEPIGDLWAVQTFVSSYYKVRKTDADAHNADGSFNDYYSSNSDNYYITNYGRLLMQYKKESTSLQFGGLVRAISNENYSRSYGIDTRTGIGEWLWNWSPFLRLSMDIKGGYLSSNYSGNSSRPSTADITPTINIVNPTRISVGNIYLTPSFSHVLSFEVNKGNSQKHISNSFRIYAEMDMKQAVTASWFDANSVQYSVPVNSRKNGLTLSTYGNYGCPLNQKKNLRFYLNWNAGYNTATSYQSSGVLDGLDTEEFDYSDFISRFWGDTGKGERFFSGESGFKESRSYIYSFTFNPALSYSGDHLQTRGGISVDLSNARYTLDSRANSRTWGEDFYLQTTWVTAKELELSTTGSYRSIRGYLDGYNYNIFRWDASISKSINGLTFSLLADDILNNNKLHSRTNGGGSYSSGAFVQDDQRLSLGRQIVLTVTFNFGKANAARNESARDTMWNLMW